MTIAASVTIPGFLLVSGSSISWIVNPRSLDSAEMIGVVGFDPLETLRDYAVLVGAFAFVLSCTSILSWETLGVISGSLI